MVRITEFTTTERNDAKEKPEVFIFSDICQHSFIGNNEQPLLRRMYFDNEKQNNIIYNNPYYIPVRPGGIQHIHFYIKDVMLHFSKKNGTLTSFKKKFPFVI